MSIPAQKKDAEGAPEGGEGRVLGMDLEEARRLGDFTGQAAPSVTETAEKD